MVQHSPSVQMHDVPGDILQQEPQEDNPDVRISQADEDKRVEPANEFYDGEKDNDKENVET